jgi:hypothetical protein
MEIYMAEHDETQKSRWSNAAFSHGTPTDRRNNRLIVFWTLAWGVGLTIGSQTLKGRILHVEAGSLRAWIFALAPVVLFVGALRAYLRFLRGTDELQRLIQLQALAVGFGVGLLLLLHWELFEFVGAPAMDPSDAVLVPIFAWIFSQIYFGWRYR